MLGLKMLNTIMDKYKANLRQLYAAIAVNLVSFTYGVYTGWPAIVTEKLKSSESPVGTQLTENTISWMCSLGMPSAILGTLFWGQLADKYGRKITGYLTMVPFMISWIILLSVRTETALMLSRFLGGLGASGAAINCPMYVGEVSDDQMNAVLGSLFMLMYNVGVLYVYVIGSYTDYTCLNAACLAVSVLFVVMWYFAKESPVYLQRQDRRVEARESLKWFRCRDNDRDAQLDVDMMVMKIGDTTAKTKWSAYFKRGTIKALLIGLVFQSGTQFSGINVILMYTVDIFKQSGSQMSPDTCAILVGAVQVFASVIGSCVVNRAGRKLLLIGTYLLTAVSLVTIGWCFLASHSQKDYDTGPLPVISLSMHVVAFSVGLGMVPYIIYAEIFPADVRNNCMSVLMFWNNALGFGVVKAYPLMIEKMHRYGCFFLLSAICLAIVPYTYMCVPETKGKTFDEIQVELLEWFPVVSGARKKKVPVSVDSSQVVAVESISQKVYMENSQIFYTEP